MIIPFFIPHAGCSHQCVFCNQKNITGQKQPLEPSSIRRKISDYLKTGPSLGPAQIAFYGGSFTALPFEIQSSYLNEALPFIRRGEIESIRISTRPDCISRETLSLLKKFHVKTVELGAQSMDDKVLLLSGRGHSALDTAHAVMLLRETGFSLGLQLMAGLPGDSPDTFAKTVDRTIALKPDFVRVYPALVLRDTPLEALYTAGRYKPLSLDEAVFLCKKALVSFGQAGIDVIRMGLQPTKELEQPDTILAGPYHPAFRQLVEASLLLNKMEALLRDSGTESADALFLVHPADLSSAVGQKRSNTEKLKKQFALKTIHIRPDRSIPRRTVKLGNPPEKPRGLDGL